MSETTATPPAAADAAAPSPTIQPSSSTTETAADLGESLAKTDLSIRSLLEAGVHFGHQARRWDPRMRNYIFGERNGTHILDLDQTLPLFKAGLSYIRESVSDGGVVLFVGTKRQAAPIIEREAKRAGQYYVNNRWLGGMLTNWKTVKKSIDNYKHLLEIQGDEEKRLALSKKELARVNRQIERYDKSLQGIKDMPRLPDAIFIVDVAKDDIAVSEGRRLAIPIIAVVDSNCNPTDIDFVVPGNDDAIRSLELYCKCVADACIEGAQARQDRIVQEKSSSPDVKAPATAGGRRVVEIKQAPRRGRGGAPGSGGGGRTHSSGGWAEKRAEGPKAETSDAPAAEPGEGETKS